MSRIAAGSAEGAEQGYRPYLQAALLMGLFTFLFLCAEYLYVDVLSRMVSGDRAVLAQNEALGVSAVGFLLYPRSAPAGSGCGWRCWSSAVWRRASCSTGRAASTWGRSCTA